MTLDNEVFRDELQALRATASGLGATGADPDVERLLEGTAFLAARLRGRITAVDDEVMQGLCAALLPTALRPLPSACIVRFTPGKGLRDAVSVPAGAAIDSAPGDGDPCRFRTAWTTEVPLAQVSAVELHAGDPPRLEIVLTQREGAAARRPGARLRLHAHADPPLARALVRALVTARDLRAVRSDDRSVPLTAHWIGPGVAAPLLPGDPGLGTGHAILAEALAWPEASLFVELRGPPGLGLADGDTSVRVVAALAHLPPELRGVGPEHLLTGCVPAINLWPARAEPLIIDGTRREHDLRVADRGGAVCWAVTGVRGSAPGRPARVWPQARTALSGPAWEELHTAGLRLACAGFDAAAEREVLSVDVWASDGARAALLAPGELRQPGGEVPGGLLCANLDAPSRPVPAPQSAQRIRALAARLRLASTGVRDGATLRSLLDLHDRRAAIEASGRTSATRWSEAVRSLRVCAAAMPLDGGVARTLVHELEIDDALLGGPASAWLLGHVLECALAALQPLGTLSCLDLICASRGERLSWPPRAAAAEA
jgi:type VI secretion system protein ImpG